jgi:hypothetical protein
LPKNWTGQVSYIPDFTPEEIEFGFGKGEPVLLLLKRDMARRWLISGSSFFAVCKTLPFSMEVYAANELVRNRISAGSATGDCSG